jgi:hypothetical protein
MEGSDGLIDWTVPSSNGNFFVEVPCAGMNYVKIEMNNTATANLSAKVHVIR